MRAGPGGVSCDAECAVHKDSRRVDPEMSQSRSPTDVAAGVREAFIVQAHACERLGSPFTAALCRVLAAGLDPANALERRVLEWPGDPSPFADSVPLRLVGALHGLVRAGRAPQLAALYPPQPLAEPQRLLAGVRSTLREHPDFIRAFLDHPPQTNEVGRSAVLIAGWLEIAARTGYPLSLFELGASAGLNLIADRYAYRFGDVPWPQTQSRAAPAAGAALTLACDWSGPLPPLDAPLQIRARRGCDRHPLDVTDPAQRERLAAYVWADQRSRLERLDAAMNVMQSAPVRIETCEAQHWLPSVLPPTSEPYVARVVCHSIFWSYLESQAQTQIATHLATVGATASTERPLAWLRLELTGRDEPAALRLTLWPGGTEEVLACAHPHGAWVRWRGE